MQTVAIHRRVKRLSLVVGVVAFWSAAANATPSFQEGSSGCSSAHCADTLQGQTNLSIPPSLNASPQIWSFTNSSGSALGLGCSAYANYSACSYFGSGPNVRIFKTDSSSGSTGTVSVAGYSCVDGAGHCNSTGDDLSTGSDVFNDKAGNSAPIVFDDGGVLAADSANLAYWNPGQAKGAAWVTSGTKATLPSTTTDKGYPVSPVMVDSDTAGTKGIVFVAEKCPAHSTTHGSDCGVQSYVIKYSGGTTTLLKANTYYTQLTDSNGDVYETWNTPSVDNTHSPARVYVMASHVCPDDCTVYEARHGAIFAIDIDNNRSSGTYGQIVHGGPKDIYDFPGPSGSSPLTIPSMTVTISGSNVTGNGIYFDGMSKYNSGGTANCISPANYGQTGTQFTGCFFGIFDTTPGSTPTAINRSLVSSGGNVFFANLYANDFFQAAAALDTRGGIWIYPDNVAISGWATNWSCGTGGTSYDNCLVRLNTQTGAIVQGPIDLTSLLGIYDDQTPAQLIPYSPGSAVTVATDSNSHVYLLTGAYTFESLRASPPTNASPRVTAIDVTTSGSETMKWVTPNGDLSKATYGQIALTTYNDGTNNHFQTVFSTYDKGPFFYWH